MLFSRVRLGAPPERSTADFIQAGEGLDRILTGRGSKGPKNWWSLRKTLLLSLVLLLAIIGRAIVVGGRLRDAVIGVTIAYTICLGIMLYQYWREH